MDLTSCGKTVPTLTTCPADTDLVLFLGVDNETGMALRSWATVKSCLIKLPLAGVVGTAGMPVAGATSWQNDGLKGLGLTNNAQIQITIAEQLMSSYGTNQSFELDNVAGIISLLFGNEFNAGDSVFVDRNQ